MYSLQVVYQAKTCQMKMDFPLICMQYLRDIAGWDNAMQVYIQYNTYTCENNFIVHVFIAAKFIMQIENV